MQTETSILELRSLLCLCFLSDLATEVTLSKALIWAKRVTYQLIFSLDLHFLVIQTLCHVKPGKQNPKASHHQKDVIS